MPRYTCSKCGEIAAADANGLVWHLRNRHACMVGRMFSGPITCGQNGCMRTFRYSYALVRHIESIHGDPENDNGVPIMDGNDQPMGHVNPADNDVVPDEQPVLPVMNEDQVKKSVGVFVAKMKASSSTVQSTVDHVVTETSSLFSDVVGMLKSKTEEFLQHRNIGQDDDERNQLLEVFNQFQHPFAELETSYQQQQYFTRSGYYIKPREIPLGREYRSHNNPNAEHVCQDAQHSTFQYIPLNALLKVVLEGKGFMRAILENPVSNDGIMRDFHDGLFCREHIFFSDQRNIQLLLYTDECEITNPLGSKAGLHKIGVIYCTILNLPPRFRSSLCNCFLVSLFKAADVKKYGYGPILEPLVNDIQLLEQQGLSIATDQSKSALLKLQGII